MKSGVAGIGAVGSAVARALDRGDIKGCKLAGFSARGAERAAQFNSRLAKTRHLPVEKKAQECDIILEALPPSMFEEVALPVLNAGKTLIALPASPLLSRNHLVELANRNDGRIVIPSGAMLGLDAIKAAAIGEIHGGMIVTRKPPRSLSTARYAMQSGLRLGNLDEPICILKGTVSEVAKEFPANVNVAAAVSLAGLEADLTQMEIWADPNLRVNTHTVSVRSDSSDFSMSIHNRPSDEKSATGRITSQGLLHQLNALLRVGTRFG